ncbi:MAG: DUF3667 domain-containing protein [Bacteroidetes bacterium]|nr:DUF3667 domain-containing protein [Bacteroidota bacterium]
MSRHHLRHDKTCLNCGAAVEERYCSHCGQENTEPKESVGHLIGHFFADVTHFDSKIFTTLKDLVFRPGFLTREYAAGKRTSYLNPIRMYIFISAMFFLVMFAGSDEHEGGMKDESEHATNVYRQQVADSLRYAAGEAGGMEREDEAHGEGARFRKGVDTVWLKDSLRRLFNIEMARRLDTVEKMKAGEESMFFSFGSGGKIVIDITENKYQSLQQYDSAQARMPDSSKNTGIFGWAIRRAVKMKEDRGRSKIRIEKNLQHTIPKVMFVLLPLFALFTGWFYSRKKYYYVQHAIFSIHFHSFIFLLFLVVLLVARLIENDAWKLGLSGIAWLLVFVYLVAALKGMYGQSFWWSLLKGVGISLLYLVAIFATIAVMVFWAFIWA